MPSPMPVSRTGATSGRAYASMVPATMGVTRMTCATIMPSTVYSSCKKRSGPTPQNMR